jgi:lipid-binding SYLF domain-containing protein
MRISSLLRAGAFALFALLAAGAASPSHAQSARIQIDVGTVGWFLGGSTGSGTLFFKGKTYPLNVTGLNAGLTFGISKTRLEGPVRNLRQVQDIAGTYASVGAGVAVAAGRRAVQMRNPRGVELSLSGTTVGLSLDALSLGGLTLWLR